MSDTKTKPHQDHRERVRGMIIQRGLDGMPPHNILEYLLFHTIPQKDVNPLAHELIERFGSFSGVLDAGYDQLMQMKGVGRTTAAFLSSLPGVFRAYQLDRSQPVKTFTSVQEVGEYLARQFAGRCVETLIMVSISSDNRLLSTHVVSSGTVTNVRFPIRKVLELALSVGAVRVAIAHNHPQGPLLPSPDDVNATRELIKVLSPVGIELLDHLIVGEDDYVSLRDSSLLTALL